MGSTPGRSIGKAYRAFPPREVWGHASPENFKILKFNFS